MYTNFDSQYIIELVDWAVLRSITHPGARDVLGLFPVYKNGTLMDRVLAMAARNAHFGEHEMLDIFKGEFAGAGGLGWGWRRRQFCTISPNLTTRTASTPPEGICMGVREMHQHDPPIAHRDLKLANVMLGLHDRPVLMDLGSAGEVGKGDGMFFFLTGWLRVCSQSVLCFQANPQIKTRAQAVSLQDFAAENCSLPYRAPELLEVDTTSVITDRTDIWVCGGGGWPTREGGSLSSGSPT